MSSKILFLLFLGAFQAHADEDMRELLKTLSQQVSELKNQVQQSNAKISELEKKLEQAGGTPVPVDRNPVKNNVQANPSASDKETKAAVTVGDAKGSYKIPGTETSIGVGGFIKLNAINNSVSAGKDALGDQSLIASQIPVGSQRNGEHEQITFHAKESRFWIRSFTPNALGDINTYFEMDLFGAADSYTPRLRHAYGSFGKFLAGQTWTTFLNVAALPDTIDNNGPLGALSYLRQPLIRWSESLTSTVEFQAALESPRSFLWSASNATGITQPNAERYPDIIARLNYTPNWGNLSVAGMGRQIRYTDTKNQSQAFGGAVSMAGKINLFELDDMRFMASYGNVLGRYASTNTFEDAAMDASGKLRLVNVYDAMLSYQHFWSKTWRSTAALGYERADQPIFVNGLFTRTAKSAQINLLWSPMLQTTIGLEYIYALRELNNGQSGDLHRVILSTRFNF